MNKKISLGAAIAFTLIVAMAVFSITLPLSQNITNKSLTALHEREAQFEKYSEINREVRQRYYGQINEKQLLDSVSSGYLSGIGDPHAVYYSAEEYSQMVEDGTQTTASIGIEAQTTPDGYLEVTKVYPESPAAIVGIKEGANIIKFDNEDVTSENSTQKLGLLTGPEGSQVSITVRYEGEENFYDLIRRVVTPSTIEWKMIKNTKIAYIIISDFDENTANQFGRILKEIQDSGASALIFDLRSNENYEISYAYRIMDRILPAGIIVSSKYKDGTIMEQELSDGTELVWPMAVIVNTQTAGVGEVFAQVLKEYGKASVVGTITAGRGVRLETIPLSDGSAIKITVAKYETAKGVSFDGEGVSPDFEVSLTGIEGDSWRHLSQQEDAQLSKAIEIVSSK